MYKETEIKKKAKKGLIVSMSIKYNHAFPLLPKNDKERTNDCQISIFEHFTDTQESIMNQMIDFYNFVYENAMELDNKKYIISNEGLHFCYQYIIDKNLYDQKFIHNKNITSTFLGLYNEILGVGFYSEEKENSYKKILK